MFPDWRGRTEGQHVYDALFEFLARRDLTPENAARRIKRWEPKTLMNFVESIRDIVRDDWSAVESPFSFIANSQLSGGPSSCYAPACRVRHAEEAGRFAALYAEQVTIQDPMGLSVFSSYNFDYGKIAVYGSLQVLWHLRPLIEAGLITLTHSHPRVGFCEEHKPAIVKSGQVEIIAAELEQRFAEQMDVTATGRYRTFEVSGPSGFTDHRSLVFELDPEGLRQRRGQKVKSRVTRGVREHLVHAVVGPIVNDIVVQHMYGAQHHLNYLTDRDADFIALSRINDPGLQTYSRALADGLEHSIPVLANLSYADLIRLRRDDGEVFAVYRDAVARVLRELTPADGQKVRQAFQDVILPEVNKIEATVSNAEKRLGKSLLRTGIFTAGAVTIGVFTGLIEPDPAKIIGAVGGITALKEAFTAANAIRTEPKEQVRDNPFYFLWKMRDQARRKAA